MKLWVTLEGRDTEVEVRLEAGRLVLEADGRRLDADFHRLPDGEVYSLLVNGRSHEVRVSPASQGVDVTLHGVGFRSRCGIRWRRWCRRPSARRAAARARPSRRPCRG